MRIPKNRLCFGISEPEPGVPGQDDGEAFGAVYKCCLCCTEMLSLHGISEPEPGVPGQQDVGVVVACYKSRLCCASNKNVVFAWVFQSLNRVCQDSETWEWL